MGNKHRIYDTWQELIEDKSHREGDCIIWDAGTHSQNYPMVRWDGKMVQVVRQQMEEKTGVKLKGRDQRVKNKVCNNVLCVNPDHYIVADYGSKEWECTPFQYEKDEQKKIYEIYKNFLSPNGTKYGYIREVKKVFPNISKTTIKKYIDRYEKILDSHE